MDKLIAAHQLALLANILAVQNQILQVLTSAPGTPDDVVEHSRRIMATAAMTLENTGALLSRLGDEPEEQSFEWRNRLNETDEPDSV